MKREEPTNRADETDEEGMNSELNLIEALLPFALAPRLNENEQRIVRLMAQLDRDCPMADTTGNDSPNRLRWFRAKATLAAIAATLLIGIVFLATPSFSGRSAQAAVARCIDKMLTPRAYKIAIRNRLPIVGDREIEATLFVDGRQRWVVEHPDLLVIGHAWLGGDEAGAWVVPDTGPALRGDKRALERWLAQHNLRVPIFSLSSLLKQLERDYSLLIDYDFRDHPSDISTALAGISQHDSKNIQVIVGKNQSPSTTDPVEVSLWVDSSTDQLLRLQMNWDERNTVGPIEWTFVLSHTSPGLPRNWFKLEGHLGPQQQLWEFSDHIQTRE